MHCIGVRGQDGERAELVIVVAVCTAWGFGVAWGMVVLLNCMKCGGE